MGLLPIFLTLTLFVFLWCLVNYHSFAGRRQYIREGVQSFRQLTGQKEEIVREISRYLTAKSIQLPAYLLQNYSFERSILLQKPESERMDQWQHFLQTNAILRDDEPFAALVAQLNEVKNLQHQHQAQWQTMVNEYDQLRNQMPYRLVATLFGFGPAETIMQEMAAEKL